MKKGVIFFFFKKESREEKRGKKEIFIILQSKLALTKSDSLQEQQTAKDNFNF